MDRIPPLVRVLQTVKACPSEWSAWDADGNWYYLRYRFGRGAVHVSVGGPAFEAEHEDFVNALTDAKLLTDFVYGHPYDGEMVLDQFLYLADMRTAA